MFEVAVIEELLKRAKRLPDILPSNWGIFRKRASVLQGVSKIRVYLQLSAWRPCTNRAEIIQKHGIYCSVGIRPVFLEDFDSLRWNHDSYVDAVSLVRDEFQLFCEKSEIMILQSMSHNPNLLGNSGKASNQCCFGNWNWLFRDRCVARVWEGHNIKFL